jgi:sugar transferase (PEP-CTERM/EpsH1 system associated)
MTSPAISSTRLIVHVVHRFGVGGLENGIVNLVNRMPRERWRHAIVALTDIDREFAMRIERPDVSVIALNKRPGHLVRDYPRLYRLFRELRPAIVHTRNLAPLEAVVPAWAAGVPVRIHGEHGWDMHDPQGRSARYRFIRRLYRPFVTRYIALSRHLEDYLERQVGVPGERVTQIYNGVDTGRFRPSLAARPDIGDCPFADPRQWLIGTVGRMEEVKDPLNLARAFVRARTLDPVATAHWRLLMVGDGALRSKVEAFLRAERVADRVWLAGERAGIADILRGLDCFVLPSLAEGISNTILEAMACGSPVVATAVGGNAELIESGMTGTLVPAANPDALAQALLAYYHDHALARRHGKAARQVVEQRFSLDRMVADYISVYERALSAAGAALPAEPGSRPAARLRARSHLTHPGR